MKYTRIKSILSFLSHEMDTEAERKFLEELKGNSELMQEFETIKLIWDEMEKYLAFDTAAGTADKEEIIAEIIAEHDLDHYGTEIDRSGEKALKETLKKMMLSPLPSPEEKKIHTLNRVIRIGGAAAAAVLVVLLVIFYPRYDESQLAANYFDPIGEPVVGTYIASTRGEIAEGITYFKKGAYQLAAGDFKDELKAEPDNRLFQFLYAVSLFETGNKYEAENILKDTVLSGEDPMYETFRWYLVLIYIDSGEQGKALPLLKDICHSGGTYSRKACRLLRKTD